MKYWTGKAPNEFYNPNGAGEGLPERASSFLRGTIVAFNESGLSRRWFCNTSIAVPTALGRFCKIWVAIPAVFKADFVKIAVEDPAVLSGVLSLLVLFALSHLSLPV